MHPINHFVEWVLAKLSIAHKSNAQAAISPIDRGYRSITVAEGLCKPSVPEPYLRA
jgi:hypothetical protein